MRVGWDLDGVCYDFAESFRSYLHQMGTGHKMAGGEPDKWHFYRDWGMTDEEFSQYCHDGVDHGTIFGIGEPRENSQKAMKLVRDMGHTVHIITDRSFGSSPEISIKNTKNWLANWDYQYDTLTFSADKTCIPTDIFIEDKLENYDALFAAGVDVYLIDRPWNQDIGDSRNRISSVWEYVKIIETKSI